MSALAKSYREEIEKIKKRKSVWIEVPTGWIHVYDKEIVDMKIQQLWNAASATKRGN